ncbi:two-component regulator propeller domain-containing protein [Undibacterium sp. Rencai35W]|uniref:two-component regulator propeller domain-containing protein n=1 Tax=Undibacterium sp. Rencai35W TaxID=3413046 RepID=UPI003BF40992
MAFLQLPLTTLASSITSGQSPVSRAGQIVSKPQTSAAPVSATQPPERWSQLADTIFQRLGKEQGLPYSIATALAEDGDGFLWVGTQSGLARWDGYRFRPYLPDPKQAGALPDGFIQTLHKDSRGRLWVGMNAGGLARYDKDQDRFVHFTAGPKGLNHVLVQSITDDGTGGVWVGTAGGLNHVDGDTDAVTVMTHDEQNAQSLPDDKIAAVLRDTKGRLWIGSSKGLVRMGKRGEFTQVPLTTSNGIVPAVWQLFEASDGRIWVGTRKNGAFIIDPLTGTALTVTESGASGSALLSEGVHAILEVNPGIIWLGTYGQGIVRIDTRSMQTRRLRHDAALVTSLSDNAVWALLKDRSGLVWAGTTRGINLFNPTQSSIVTIFGAANRRDSISDTDVLAVLPAKDGRVWIGLRDNGIDILDPSGMRVGALRPDPKNPEKALPNDRVYTMSNSPAGDVYIGTARGAYKADLSGRQVERLLLAPRDPAASVDALMFDDRRLWIGSREDGLWLSELQQKNQSFRPEGYQQLTDQRVNVIERGKNGAAWIGTLNGLNFFNADLRSVSRIAAAPATSNALSAAVILSMLTDRQGRIWVSTIGGGINVVERYTSEGQPVFRRLGKEQGLPSDTVAHLLLDREGKIWASTSEGLAVIDPADFRIRTLHRADGVGIAGYWSHSGAVTAEGELLFGGVGGLTVVRPDKMEEWTYRPPVVVTEVRIGGKVVALDMLHSGDGDSDASDVRVLVPPDTNSIAVEFSALDYSAPENNRYQYRLEGFDKDWITTDYSRRLASYTNLPPGNYRLLLRGSNRNGVWTENALELPIRVLPAWYQTYWFRTLLALACLAVVVAIVRRRTAYLRLRQSELENEVRQRTLELREKQTALELANKGLSEANVELALSADVLRQLSDIGREITGSLYSSAVFKTVHHHIGGIFGDRNLSIYRINFSGDRLDREFGREDGLALPDWSIDLASPTSNAARAVREKIEVLMNLSPDSVDQTHIPGTRQMRSALFAPLMIDERVLGVMTIQSEREHAYGNRECMIFRTICSYVAIALDNAEAYKQLKLILHTLSETQSEVVRKNIELERTYRELKEISLTDPLTGLGNRRYLLQHMDADVAWVLRQYDEHLRKPALPAPAQADLILFLVDLDHFKIVNDTHGHAAGDLVLIEMRARLEEVFRDSDYLVRWGGEEFLIVARAVNRSEAEGLAERLCTAVARTPFVISDNVTLVQTCSVGFACYPFLPHNPHLLTWLQVLELADQSLYRAKVDGRNAWDGIYGTEYTREDDFFQRVMLEADTLLQNGELERACRADYLAANRLTIL